MGILDHCFATMRGEPQFAWRDRKPGKRKAELALPGYTREGSAIARASELLCIEDRELDEVQWDEIRREFTLAPAMFRTVQKKIAVLRTWRAQYPRELAGARCEVGFRRTRDGRFLETRGRAHGYPDVEELEPCCTVDLLARWLHQGRWIPWVIEMKSGFGFQEDPVSHAQARTCSWLAGGALRERTVASTVLRIEEHAFFELPLAQRRPHVFDSFDLEVVGMGIDEHIENISRDREQPVAVPMPGPHCSEKFCPSRYSCAAGLAWKAERKAG